MLDIVIALILDDSVPNRESRQRFFARMEVEPNAAVDALQDDMVRHVCAPCCAIVGRLIDRPPDHEQVLLHAMTIIGQAKIFCGWGQAVSFAGTPSARPASGWPNRSSGSRYRRYSAAHGAVIVSRTTSLGAVTIAVAITGCAVGPDFHRPPAPADTGYTREPLATQTAAINTRGGEAQHFVPERDIPGEWWTLFRSEPLNRLIEQSLHANPDIDAAQAALQQARENVYAGEGALFPRGQPGSPGARSSGCPAPPLASRTSMDIRTRHTDTEYLLCPMFSVARGADRVARGASGVSAFQLEATI